MLAMAVPMVFFYEISILVGKLLARSERRRQAV
jgi:Sec-independent protein secretion pathway component TatC